MDTERLTLRPLAGPAELPLFNRLSYCLDGELAADLEEGRRRPGWMWVALDGDRPVARAAWWAGAGATAPALLDVLDLDDALPRADRVAAGERLLRAALPAVVPEGTRPPSCNRFLPPAWRDDAATAAGVADRVEVLERLGARPFVERLRLEWRPDAPLPPAGALDFRAPAGREELLDLMTGVLEGTLDAHSRDDLTRMGPREAAVLHYEQELALYSSPRQWWRVGLLPGGEPVGFVLPARNPYNAVIAYLGVLPAHRGRGHAAALLAEGTRVLAAEGVPRIRASTDLTNVPMAETFRRAGYRAFQHELVMTWS
jgi:ribosomal protein S18 acetylase RimI-like enzyme